MIRWQVWIVLSLLVWGTTGCIANLQMGSGVKTNKPSPVALSQSEETTNVTSNSTSSIVAGPQGQKNKPTSFNATSDELLEDNASAEESLEGELITEPLLDESANVTLSPQEQNVLAKKEGFNFELDIHETKELVAYFKFYAKKHRKTFIRWLERAQRYIPFVRKVFQEQGLPEDLVLLPFAESGYNPWAYSRAGAAGMWQFMPGTARKYGLKVNWWIDERRDPYKSTYAAARLLKNLYQTFGDWYLALAAYNAGEAKILKAIKRSKKNDYFGISRSRRYLKRETRHYVPKFLAILKIVKHLKELGFPEIDLKKQFPLAKITLSPRTDLVALSNYLGLDWATFRDLNPALRRTISPPWDKVVVYLPPDKLALARKFIQQKKKVYAGIIRYRVKPGDSLWLISRRFGVPVKVIKSLNKLHSNLLRPKTYLLLPKNNLALVRLKQWSRSLGNRPKPQGVRSVYVVKPGDSLWTISRKLGVSVSWLKKVNGLKNNHLRPGQRLYVSKFYPRSKPGQKPKKIHFNYVVQKGDSLWTISKKFGVSVASIKVANNLRSARLKPGQRLYVPDLGVQKTRLAQKQAKNFLRGQLVWYRVRKGDSLWTISRKFGVKVQELLRWNKLSQNNVLRPGKKLKVYVQ